jgi:hypothetical protein
MKPIRNYSDGQWLLLLWGFVLMFLLVGIFISTLVLVIAVLGALGAGYTTYLYLRANNFSLPFLPASRSRAAEHDDEYEDEYDDDGDDDADDDYEYDDDDEDEPAAPVVDSFERPAGTTDARQSETSQSGIRPSDPPTSPDLSEGDTR